MGISNRDPFVTLEQKLEQAIGGIRKFDPRMDISRFGQNLKTLRAFNRLRRSSLGTPSSADSMLQAMISVLPDVCELIGIYEQLSSQPSTRHFLQRIKKLLEGPAREADEKQTSIGGRNLGFELIMACYMAQAGLQPDFTRPGDLSVLQGKTRVNIECKRLQSTRNTRRPFADACAQLRERAEEALDRECRGVVALSIGKVTHRGEKLLEAESRKAGLEQLREEMQLFIDKYGAGWRQKLNASVDLVLIYLSATVYIPARQSFFWTQSLGHFAVKPLVDQRFQAFVDRLAHSRLMK